MAKKKEFEVKSKGETIGNVTVDEYESMAEAVKALGDERCLGLINRQNKQDTTNEFRANSTRVVTPITELKQLQKQNPAIEKDIAAIIARYKK